MKDLLIVVPYRNREEHLKGFLENSPKYFNQTGLTYDILICELDQSGDWNAGLCVNALVDFVNEERCYEWLYIHHVDIWPISGQWEFPLDKQVFFNMGDYGSCLMKLQTFFDVDGYSNSFWGWGGEDNELYEKLKYDGYNVIDYSTKNAVSYNTQFQNHERKFNGKNYANAIKQHMLVPRSKRTNIKDFSEHGFTSNLTEIQPHVFHQFVHPKQKSPNQTINKQLLITYITDTSSFDKFITYTKSAQLHASYDFDMVALISNDDMSSWCVNQLQTFGIECIPANNLNKYLAYSQFLQSDDRYEFILHVDSNDTCFQTNPFVGLSKNNLTALNFDGVFMAEAFSGPKNAFLKLCEELNGVEESNFNNVMCNLLGEKATDTWGAILTPNSEVIVSGNREIRNKNNERYSILINCNSYPDFKTNIDKHFQEYYFPVCY